jgi:hypothetical protein
MSWKWTPGFFRPSAWRATASRVPPIGGDPPLHPAVVTRPGCRRDARHCHAYASGGAARARLRARWGQGVLTRLFQGLARDPAKWADGEGYAQGAREAGCRPMSGNFIFQAFPKAKRVSRHYAANPHDSGAGERSRTLDLLITNELLYQLSYTGVSAMPHKWDTAKPAILAQRFSVWQQEIGPGRRVPRTGRRAARPLQWSRRITRRLPFRPIASARAPAASARPRPGWRRCSRPAG